MNASPLVSSRGAHVRRARAAAVASLLVLTTLLAACGSSSGTGATGATKLTVGLTYIPNIQFAPFYVAEEKGYYQQAGLDVTLNHHNVGEDEFAALVAGHEDVIFASGDEVLGAKDQGVSIVDVATTWTQYPVAVIVPASSSIENMTQLRGKTIGVPGLYGATYIGLLALLKTSGMSPSDVKIQSIGYTQVAALLGHHVDAVVGYVNNEALGIAAGGMPVRTFTNVNSQQPLISNGIAALEGTLQAKPDAIKAFVAATLKGFDYAAAHPDDAVNLSKKYVPTLADPTQAASALAVLNATIPLWQVPSGAKPGYNDPQAWASMAAFMSSNGLLKTQIDTSTVISNDYLPS